MPSPRLITPALALLACSCASAPSASLQPENPQLRVATTAKEWTSRLVDPVSAGTTFESPLIHTSLNAHAMTTSLPNSSIFDGGDYQLYALQTRYAITDRFAFIATKDGYIVFNPDEGSDEEGWADLGLGFKYAIVDNPERGILVTPGFTVEMTQGSRDVFQGNGDGLVRPFVSAGWDLSQLDGGSLNTARAARSVPDPGPFSRMTTMDIRILYCQT